MYKDWYLIFINYTYTYKPVLHLGWNWISLSIYPHTPDTRPAQNWNKSTGAECCTDRSWWISAAPGCDWIKPLMMFLIIYQNIQQGQNNSSTAAPVSSSLRVHQRLQTDGKHMCLTMFSCIINDLNTTFTTGSAWRGLLIHIKSWTGKWIYTESLSKRYMFLQMTK